MEQRRLRLGDILDDYCPRERRVTNHAVVAMVEEDVKQTRCTTCDAEHAYKGGKEPRRRKKDAASGLYKEVLAGMPEPIDVAHPEPVPVPHVVEAAAAAEDNGEEPPVVAVDETPEEPVTDEPREDGDDGPFHRRLIRATLPRPEGQKDVRQSPEFTIRQNGGRGNGHQSFRGGSKMRVHGGNGNRPQGGGGGPRRFGPSTGSGRGPAGPGRGPMTGSGRGPSTGSGRGGGMPGMRSGRNRKRSR